MSPPTGRWARWSSWGCPSVESAGVVRLVGVGRDSDTSSRLFAALAQALTARGIPATYEIRRMPGGLGAKWHELRDCRRRLDGASAVLVHTPLLPATLLVAAALTKRVPIYSYVWDLHPESSHILDPVRRSKARSGLHWLIERGIMAVSRRVVVPSEDYLPWLRFLPRRIRVVPLWPTDVVLPPVPRSSSEAGPIKVAFAGQVNQVRGLMTGVRNLRAFWGERDIELHVFGTSGGPNNPLDELSADRIKVLGHGYVDPATLGNQLRHMDFGLVSLDPTFPLPAYPSKAMTYLCAGLPILFSGPELPAYRAWLSGNGIGFSIDRGAIDRVTISAFLAGFDDARMHYLHSEQARWASLPV